MRQLDDVGTTLLKAASDLLADEGASALTVRRIAAEAGMSTMNVYSRFGSKDGVVEHLFIEGFRLLAEEMHHAGTTDDPLADLRRCGQAYRRFALTNATLYSVMFDRVVPDFMPSAEALAVAGDTLAALASRLERAMQADLVSRRDPLHAAAIVWATCHGVMSLELKHAGPETIEWERVFDDACAAIVRGLAE